MDKETMLIERLKAQVKSGQVPTSAYDWHRQHARKPVTQQELDHAEAILGFALPPLLKRVYLEIGNGGFGPAYGLFELYNEHQSQGFDSIVQTYLDMRSMTQEDIDEHWEGEDDKPTLWPEKLLMICDWGCNIYSCVDCASPEYRILHMDSNMSESEFAIESPSLYQWFEGWLDGKLSFKWDQAEKIVFPS